MQKSIQWTSDNGVYKFFGAVSPFFLVGDVETTVGSDAQTIKPPMWDGADTYNPTLEQMVIKFNVAVEVVGNGNIRAKQARDEFKNMLAFAFVPNQFGTIIYNNHAGEHYARCKPVQIPVPKDDNSNFITYTVELVSDFPMWQGKQHSAFVGSVTKLLRYPIRFPTRYGEYQQGCIIYNSAPTIIKPTFEVSSVLTSFEVSNETTGQSFSVNHQIISNEKMVIDTLNSTVRLHKSNGTIQDVTNNMDGDFIHLQSGENRLVARNQLSGGVPSCKVVWREPRANA